MSVRYVLAVLAAMLMFPPAAAQAGSKNDLIAADKAFSALSVAKGSNEAFLAYIADDGHLFGNGSKPPIVGKAEAAKRFSDPNSGNGASKRTVLSWTPDDAGVSGDGSVGWTDGGWLFLGAPDEKGKRLKLTGHYLTVWKKDASGAWKVAADMGTSDPRPNVH